MTCHWPAPLTIIRMSYTHDSLSCRLLTQQHAVTVICMVFRPTWHTFLRYRGLCEVLFSPRSIARGLALTLTVTDCGQLVLIWRSSWWKHFNCSSRSDLKKHTQVRALVFFYLFIFFLLVSTNVYRLFCYSHNFTTQVTMPNQWKIRQQNTPLYLPSFLLTNDQYLNVTSGPTIAGPIAYVTEYTQPIS